MNRAVLLLLVVAFGYGLASGADRHSAADHPPFDPGGRCPTNASFPARTEVILLPPTPQGYGSIQYGRTPLPPRTVALTFDDGPAIPGDRLVFDILEARCISAVFFHVGAYAEQRPELVREAIRRGHGVASHSWSHPTALRYWPAESAHREIISGLSALQVAANPARPEPFFRFPGLNDSAELREWMAGRGVTVVGAEAGADDWKLTDADEISTRAVANLEQTNGGILILHQTRAGTIEALPGILDDLNRRGFRFVRISGSVEPAGG